MRVPSLPVRVLNASVFAITLSLGGDAVLAENSWSFDGPQGSPGSGEIRGRGPVAIGPDREVYYAFSNSQAGSADVYFRRSTDFGVTWSSPTKVDTDAPGLNDSYVQALLADGNWVYVVFLDRREGGSGRQGLRLNVSSDRGLTWLQQDILLCGESRCAGSAQLSLGRPGEIYAAASRVYASKDHGTTWVGVHEFVQIGGYPRIASDRSGNVYAVKPGPSTLQSGFATGLSVDASHDGGLSWSDPVVIDSRPVFNLSPRVSCDPWGNVYVAFEAQTEDETLHVFVSHSNDSGATFSPPLRVDDEVDLGPYSPISPLLASDCSGNAYVVFAPPAKLVRTNDFGNSWTPTPISIQPATAYGLFPDLAVDPNGRVIIAYDSWEGSERRIRYDHSADEGRTWLEDDVLVAGTSSYPTVVPDGEGHAYVTWADGGFRVGHADFGMSLTSGPAKTTFLTVPPEGGSVRLTGTARNASGSSIQDLAVVLELLAPDGSTIEVLVRKRLSLPDGGLRRRSVRRSVAGALPPGLYRFRVSAADPLADQAFVCVMKE